MSRQQVWLDVYNRFDPFQPAAEHVWRADRPRSPAGDIIKLLRGPFDGVRVLVTGTTGTGKSTELLRIAEARSSEDFVVVLDLQKHFSEVVGDEQALRNISSWEVIFLAGLAVVRAAKEIPLVRSDPRGVRRGTAEGLGEGRPRHWHPAPGGAVRRGRAREEHVRARLGHGPPAGSGGRARRGRRGHRGRRGCGPQAPRRRDQDR
ncbi:MAG: hypothetical protein QM820_63450 [Minicystis sp.]